MRELVLLANVVPGGVYFVVSGLNKNMGNLAICVWVVKVGDSWLSVYFMFIDTKFCSFIAG